MSPHEREIIGLAVCCAALSNLVNRQMLTLTPVANHPGEVEVRFPSGVHRDLFLVRLLDFMSERGSADLLGTPASCLRVLLDACNRRHFDVSGSAAALDVAVTALNSWISQVVRLKLWLPTLRINACLNVTRLELLKISGNQAKHNPSRLTGIANLLHELLHAHGYVVPITAIPLALDDLREHLGDNFFIYYATWIGELLNNLWWGVCRYLMPTHSACFVRDDVDPQLYRYDFPPSINDEVARQWFWGLMDAVRQGPYIQPFKGASYLKGKSALERDYDAV